MGASALGKELQGERSEVGIGMWGRAARGGGRGREVGKKNGMVVEKKG